MARMSWSYLAGLFDGEGTIHVTTTHIRWSIGQAPPGLPVLQEVEAFLKDQGIHAAVRPNRYRYKGRPKIMHVLIVATKADVRQICATLLPYLHTKRVQALDTWRFLTLYPALRSAAGARGASRAI